MLTRTLLPLCLAVKPAFSPRRLRVWNTKTGAAICDLNFVTAVLAVRMNRQRLVAVLERKIYIFDINSMKILETLDTSPNPKALCVLSPHDNGHLAFPSGAVPGEIVLYDANNLSVLNAFQAHRGVPVAMAFNAQGTLLATASETVGRSVLSIAPHDEMLTVMMRAGDAHQSVRGAERQEGRGVPARVVRRAGVLPRLQRELHDPVRVQRHGYGPLLLADGLGELGDRQLWPLCAHHVDARRGG